MARDHFVAQTFLKHFTDGTGKLHAYSKIDGRYFTPQPSAVCREWDDDLNPAIPGMPDMLGQYRDLFEPQWNDAVEELKMRNASKDVRMLVALCFAHMVTCVPAWRRVSGQIWANMQAAKLRFRHEVNEQRGIKDDLLAKGIAMMDDGKIVLEADPNDVKADLTGNALRFASLVYHSNWVFFENNTDIPFVTADNPVALQLSEEIGGSMTRFMPITPKLGLVMQLDAWEKTNRQFPKEKEELDRLLKEEPFGKVRGLHPLPRDVRDMNRRVVQCAENFVFSNRNDEGIQGLVAKYTKYRIEPDPQNFKDRDGAHIHGFVIRVRPRTD